MSSAFVAGGNILPCRFVSLSITLNRTVVQAAATDTTVIGISQVGTHLTPLLTLDDTFAAVAGENIQVYTKDDEEAWLELGTGGCAAGDFLKPSTLGVGITAASTNFYGARALEAGVSGQIIRVQPAFGTL